MDRRQFLGSAATVTVSVAAGCVGRGVGGDNGGTTTGGEYTPLTDHYHSQTVAYHHEQLRLRADDSTIPVGGTVRVTITNVSNSSTTLGCGNPWTIQKSVESEWRDVLWTSAEGYKLCVTGLSAGESTVVSATISEAALETQTKEVRLELNPGQYRFVLLSTAPYLAANFRVRA